MSDNRKMYRFTAVRMIFCLCGIFSAAAQAGTLKDLVVVKSKVLVIMSYDDSFPWVTETKEGIDSVLSQTCEVRYFYMDTKRNPPGAAQKAKEAFSLYQEFQPDGVIASDDDAQSAFAVPYLKDKVKTPVMFCGVNADAGKYGYPAANVSGILERYHVSESVAFVRQIIPSVKTFGYIMTDGSTGTAALEQIQSEAPGYPAKFTAYKMPKTLKETKAMTEELKSQCDTLFTPTMQGIVGDDGKSLSDKEVLPIVAEIFGKAVIGGSGYNIKYGMLCGVIKTGQEQGNMAAKMLLKAMEGTPVSQIPVIRNHNGKRIVNATVMKALGVKPNPAVLEGAELVRTEK